jgi:hypothetical protein
MFVSGLGNNYESEQRSDNQTSKQPNNPFSIKQGTSQTFTVSLIKNCALSRRLLLGDNFNQAIAKRLSVTKCQV